MVLLINNQYWAEIFAQEPGNGARSMRHAAYRQFVLSSGALSDSQ